MAIGIMLFGAALGGCARSSQSMRSQMSQWASTQGYVSADATVQEDLAGIAAGIRQHDLLGVRTDCVGFSTDIDQIYGGLPAPDRTVTDELNVALTKYWEPGAEQCYNAKSFSSASFVTFQRDLRLGGAVFAKAESRIRSYGIG